MRTTTSVLALAGLAAAANGQTVIEFNQLVIDAAQTITFTVLQEDPGPLLAFTWDLTYEALTPSWGSELNIMLEHESGFTFTFDGSEGNLGDVTPSDFTFGWGDSSGVFISAGAFPVFDGPQETLGVWTVTIFEDFDDSGNDGVLNGSITINKVPAPGALAVLGLGGAVGARRRRRA